MKGVIVRAPLPLVGRGKEWGSPRLRAHEETDGQPGGTVPPLRIPPYIRTKSQSDFAVGEGAASAAPRGTRAGHHA